MNTDRTTLAKTAFLLCVGIAALVIGSTADANASGAKVLVVKLQEKNGSSVSGVARLISTGPNLRVVLRLSKPLRDNLPAHIHTGPCRLEPTWSNPRLMSSLNSVVNGKSDTTVSGTTLQILRAASYSINVHKSAYPNRAIVCGDIPRASRTASGGREQ